MLKTDTLQITPEMLNLIARIDEFKGAWQWPWRLVHPALRPGTSGFVKRLPHPLDVLTQAGVIDEFKDRQVDLVGDG